MNNIEHRRNDAIRLLWCIFRELSDVVEPEDITDEDMTLWGLVTSHSAVQDRLTEHFEATP
jgi:hypothetical protein